MSTTRSRTAGWLVVGASIMVTVACGSAAATQPGRTHPASSPSAPASATPSRAPSPSPAGESPPPSLDVALARDAFAYGPGGRVSFTIISTRREGGATVRDVTYLSGGDRTVSALLVSPGAAGPHAAVLFLHWYATNEPDGDRTEFLDEAVALASRGVASLLPEQRFPWHQAPTGIEADHQAVIDQVVDLRVGLDALLALPEVDPGRVAVVGHDFGGMYAALVAGLDERIDGAVVMAGVPHFADWYLRYWHPVASSDVAAYRGKMLEVDPVTFLPGVGGPILLQFADGDRFVDQTAIDAWTAVAPAAATTVERYDSDHSLRTEAARTDREAFLVTLLGLGE